jgi:hypothetical protein
MRFAGPPAGASSPEAPSTLIEAVSRRIVEAVAAEIAAVDSRLAELRADMNDVKRQLDAVRMTTDPRPLLNEINVRLAEVQGTLMGRIESVVSEAAAGA